MKKNRYVTKMNLYIRILVAGYVLYLAYQLIPSVQTAEEGEKLWMIIATSILALAGLVIVGFSVKGLIRKEYYEPDEIAELEAAGEADAAEQTETSEETAMNEQIETIEQTDTADHAETEEPEETA